jgi:transitional endoplasmic reticulum ATPase
MQPQNSYTANFKNSTQPNQRNYSQVSFGYDQKANDELKKATSGLDPFHRKTILNMQKECKRIEDEILKTETTDLEIEHNFKTLSLLEAKKCLANLVLAFLPSSNFVDKESDAYDEEAENINTAIYKLYTENNNNEGTTISRETIRVYDEIKKPEWRYALSEMLSELTAGDGYITLADDPIRTNVNQSEEKPNQIEKYKIKPFEPTIFSPKGFDDVSGMEDIKKYFKKHIINPLTNPEEYKQRAEKYGNTNQSGYLLYGPPGCGKTMIVEALAEESKLPLYKLDLSEMGSPFIHQASINLRKGFEQIEQVVNETKKPVILFIDEFDGFASSRDNLAYNDYKLEETSVLLNFINNASQKGIILIAATNNPQNLDIAAKRTGRFDNKFYVSLPDLTAREKHISKDLAKREMASDLLKDTEQVKQIAKLTEGYSFSDINVICKNASELAEDRDDQIKFTDFKSVLENSNIEKMTKEYLSRYNPPKFKTNNADVDADKYIY